MEEGKDTYMTYKILGMVLIIVGCGGAGFSMAANHRMEEKSLRQLVGILDYMECELQYRLTTLPELCRNASKEFCGVPGKILYELSNEIESQIAPNVACCMQAVLGRNKRISPITMEILEQLGMSIGRFDLEGQLKNIILVRELIIKQLDEAIEGKNKNYKLSRNMGVFVGLTIMIILL